MNIFLKNLFEADIGGMCGADSDCVSGAKCIGSRCQ